MNIYTDFKVVGYKTVHTAKNGDMLVLNGTYPDSFTTGEAVGSLWLSGDDKKIFESIKDDKKIGTVAVCRPGYNKQGNWTLFLEKFKM